MTGDVVQGPMGVTIVTERDESEFARLSQLGDVLGLSQVRHACARKPCRCAPLAQRLTLRAASLARSPQMDVYTVHQGLAEQAFKNQVRARGCRQRATRRPCPAQQGRRTPMSRALQVQSIMGDGNLTESRAKELEALREKMGLAKDAADKIIRGFSNQKLIQAMQVRRVRRCRALLASPSAHRLPPAPRAASPPGCRVCLLPHRLPRLRASWTCRACWSSRRAAWTLAACSAMASGKPCTSERGRALGGVCRGARSQSAPPTLARALPRTGTRWLRA